MSKDDALRDLVAAELEELSAENGLLHAVSDRSTAILFNDSAERLNFREQIAEDYLERESIVDREGYMQVITAGVPGAGKSTTIERLGLDMKGYRVIDADIVKEYLLDDAMKQETYADILGRRLRDGKLIMLMELSGLVHVESASIADLIRRGCLERGENIIVEGTLSWPGLVDRYINEVNDFGYVGLEIVDVEVPAELAKKRALNRWWKDRKTSARSGGGRFTPAAVIDGSFGENRERSVCFDNANRLFSHPKSIDIETITPED